ncbi:MAG: YlmC/YmxH family sporulation protein [Clostridiales bacterium]|nr:YlmC/YmxH family sporulation protein [Clostridiales bacterium]
MTYCELKRREVINGSDGRRMGHIVDLVFSPNDGKVKGIILPYGKRGVFGKSQDLFVPWQCIQKIGEDVILVEIHDLPCGTPTCTPRRERIERIDRSAPPPPSPPNPHKKPDRACDGKCEKCMLFDCADRWEGAAC